MESRRGVIGGEILAARLREFIGASRFAVRGEVIYAQQTNPCTIHIPNFKVVTQRSTKQCPIKTFENLP
jgi:hypothetical protein